MNSSDRRESILSMLKDSKKALSASFLASKLDVSRQVIVGDIALLRARGAEILSTSKGYIMVSNLVNSGYSFQAACIHDFALTKDELCAIVDNRGCVMDVKVDHPLYGELGSRLDISSRADVYEFIVKVEDEKASLLSALTNGVHLHTISCPGEEEEKKIMEALRDLGVLYTG